MILRHLAAATAAVTFIFSPLVYAQNAPTAPASASAPAVAAPAAEKAASAGATEGKHPLQEQQV